MVKVLRIGSVVRALMMGIVSASAVVVTGSVMLGCADEQAAETHVKRLTDPVKRTASVERLIQMYNDKMTLDRQDRNGEHVKPLFGAILGPLSELAEKGDLDQKTQGKLLAMLADTRDPRVVKALVKALDSYKMDDKRPDDFDTNMNDVVRNIGEMKTLEAGEAILKLFSSMHYSWPKAQNKTFGRTLQDTMTALNDPRWEDGLIKLLDAPIKTLNNKEAKAIADQMYWQTVSALILGNIKSQKAVPALIKVVLSPFKGPVGVTAISALIKLGKPSIDAGVALLTGANPALAKYAEDEFLRALEDKFATENKGEKVDDKKKADAKKAYLENAVIIVSNVGRAECIAPMLAHLEKADETSDSIIARELYKLPKDEKVTAAFKKVWDDTKIDATVSGANAKQMLTEAAPNFADQKLATAIAQAAEEMKPGEGDDVVDLQDAALVMLMKIGGPAQLDLLEKLALKQREGKPIGDAYKKELPVVRAMIKECGDKPENWLKKLGGPDAQKETGFVGIKAAYMAAALGGESVRGNLVDVRLTAANAAVAFTLESLIDRLAPKGDQVNVEKLQGYLDRALSSRDEERIRSVANLKTVVGRLRARAQ